MKFLRVNLLLFVLGCMSAGAEVSTSDLLRRLLEGNEQVIPTLVERKSEAIPLLLRMMTPDPEEVVGHLARLGAEAFQDRNAATEALIAMGGGIRREVAAFRRQNHHDPEIVYRCNLILEKLTEGTTAGRDRALVSFLLACGELEASVVRQFGDGYRRVFERKDLDLLRDSGTERNFDAFSIFVDQYLHLPGGGEELLKWVLSQSNGERALGTVRLLLLRDFEKFHPLVLQRSRHAHAIERLINAEFSDRLGEKEILRQLKSWYDAARPPAEVDFDPEAPVTPEIAFAILDRKGMRRLEPMHYDFLFEKLEPMSSEALLQRLSEKPAQGNFMRQLAERRTDLQEPLATLVMKQLEEIETLGLWDVYIRVATDSLGVVFSQGALDGAWARMMHLHDGRPGGLTWGVEMLNLSPSLVLEMISTYDTHMENQTRQYVNPFAYLLNADDPEVRRGAVSLARAKMAGKEFQAPDLLKFWTAGLRHPEPNDPDLAQEKIEMLGQLRPADGPLLFSRMGNSELFGEFEAALIGFYEENRVQFHQFFQETPLRPGMLEIMHSLSANSRIDSETGERLREALVQFLRNHEREAEETTLALFSGLNLNVRDPVWTRVLLKHLQEGISDPFDFPIWRLDDRHRDLLPDIEERLAALEASSEGSVLPLLCAGIMIQPDHPSWRPRIDRLLRETGDVEDVGHLIRALVIVNREPDLSRLADTRLAEWLDTSDSDAIARTDAFLPKLFRRENKAVALKTLAPNLEALMSDDAYLSGLNGAFYLLPEGWAILGEALMSLMESGSPAQKRSAASTLTSLDHVPASVSPRLGEILGDANVDISIRSNMLWIVARMGSDAVTLTEMVREIPVDDQRLHLRRAFALASISEDAVERQENLERLKEAYLEDPSWLRLRKIGLLRSMDEETLPFLKELVRRGIREDAKELKYYYLREIIYRATNFPDPEVAWDLYREVLEALGNPELPQPGVRRLADPIFQRLIQHYPERLEEMMPQIEALPEALKGSWRYRQLMETMSASAEDASAR